MNWGVGMRRTSKGEAAAEGNGVSAIGGPRLTLLGEFDATTCGVHVRLTRNPQRVLAFLALQDRPVGRDHLAACLWLDATDAHAGANLRSALWKLGRAVAGCVEVGDHFLRLAPDVDVDLREGFAVARHADLATTCSDVSEDDIDLLSRDLLPTWDDDWLVAERERFRQLRLHALEAICTRNTSLGRFTPAIEAGLAAVAGDSLRESAHRVLIGAFIAEGNVYEAVRQYRTFRKMLRAELDVDPSPAMEQLAAAFAR